MRKTQFYEFYNCYKIIYIVSGKGNQGRFYLSLNHGQVRLAWLGWSISDDRIDLAPRRQRRLERKRANDKRYINHPKAWAYVVDFFVASLSAKRFRKILATGLALPIAEKNQRCKLNVSSSTFKILSRYCWRFSISWNR